MQATYHACLWENQGPQFPRLWAALTPYIVDVNQFHPLHTCTWLMNVYTCTHVQLHVHVAYGTGWVGRVYWYLKPTSLRSQGWAPLQCAWEMLASSCVYVTLLDHIEITTLFSTSFFTISTISFRITMTFHLFHHFVQQPFCISTISTTPPFYTAFLPFCTVCSCFFLYMNRSTSCHHGWLLMIVVLWMWMYPSILYTYMHMCY